MKIKSKWFYFVCTSLISTWGLQAIVVERADDAARALHSSDASMSSDADVKIDEGSYTSSFTETENVEVAGKTKVTHHHSHVTRHSDAPRHAPN